MSREVPFKDFLFFLYQSATPSPASTRESSLSRSHTNNATLLKSKEDSYCPKNGGKSLERSKSKSYGDLMTKENVAKLEETVRKNQDNTERVGGHLGLIIHHGLSSKYIKNETKKSHSSNKVNEAKVATRNNSDNYQLQKSNSSNAIMGAGVASKVKTTFVHNDSTISKKDLSKDKKRVPLTNPSPETKANKQNQLKTGVHPVSKRLANNHESKNEGKSSYRELLGDYPRGQSSKNDNKRSSYEFRVQPQSQPGQEDTTDETYQTHPDLESEIDREREEDDGGLPQLYVHSDHHDLSFFKNFSATTRSKSSLAAYILAQSNDKSQYYSFQQGYDPNQQFRRHEIYYNYIESKRLSRSTPTALDAITGEPCGMIDNSDSGLVSDISPTHLKETYNELSGTPQDDFQNLDLHSASVLSNYSDSNEGKRIGDMAAKKLSNSSTIDQYVGVKRHFHSRKSSPALNTKDATLTCSPRRINTSNEAIVPVSRNKGTRSNGSTTTVTVKMDNASLFLDTVYVNMKQDIDTAASIQLFY